MNPRRPEMADIVRTHHSEFLARWNPALSREQRKALRDIRDCRTGALGGRVQQCDRCGHRVILYNSCLMESIL
jgi:Transposase zinc-binding domain